MPRGGPPWRTLLTLGLVLVTQPGRVWPASPFSPCEESLQLCTCSPDSLVADCSRKGLGEPPTGLPEPLQELSLARNALGSRGNGSHSLYLGSLLSKLPNLVSMDLSGNDLTAVLAPVHRELRVLDLSNNNISSATALKLEGLVALTKLDLSSNKLISLPSHSFPASLPLTSLNLKANRILSLEMGCLDSVASLEELNLAKNRLSSFPKGLFKRLQALQYLDLSRNKIVEVGGLTFDGLERLKVLKMKRNQIGYLNDGAFYGLTTIEELHLDRNHIEQVDKGWLYGQYTLQLLSLAHNRIDYITDDAWEFCKKLTDLDLRFNRLQLLHRDYLRNLPQLRRLYLKSNVISHIQDKDTFAETPLLEELDLSLNKISYSVEDMVAPFSGLSRLLQLSLSGNHIKSVGDKAFLELDDVREIDLRNNVISSVQENPFHHLKSLERLLLDSKSLLCDCHLKWLPLWLNDTATNGAEPARCAHPEKLKGKTVLSVAYADFTCEDFPKPYILEQPATQIALKGANISLVCRAASTSPEEMFFQWKHESHDLRDLAHCSNSHGAEPCLKQTSNNFDGKERDVTSELQFTNASYNDAGRYQCVVSNRFGATYSDKANITVYVYPTFLVTPEDITVEGGQTAELKCAAKGVPAPMVSWSKDSGSNFPAASERRISVSRNTPAMFDQSATGNSFFIYSVRAQDMGVYTCAAENPAGKITWNITLSVLEAPRFVKPMERKKSVPLGVTAVLECLTSGSPKPLLTWTKNGGRLNMTERHFFTADSKRLVIVKVKEEDAGTYECSVHNRLGAQRQNSVLEVVPAGSTSMSGGFLDKRVLVIVLAAILCLIFLSVCIWLYCCCRARWNSRREAQRRALETNGTSQAGSEFSKSVRPGAGPPSLMLLGGKPGEGEFDIHEHVRQGLIGKGSSEAAAFRGSCTTVRSPETGVLTTDLSLSSAASNSAPAGKEALDSDLLEERDSGIGGSKKSSEAPPERLLPVLPAEAEEEEEEEEDPLMGQGGGEGAISLSEFNLGSAVPYMDDIESDNSSDHQGGGEGQWSSADLSESTNSSSLKWNSRLSQDPQPIYQNSPAAIGNAHKSESAARGKAGSLRGRRSDASPSPFKTFHPRGRRERQISEMVRKHAECGMRPSQSSFNVLDVNGAANILEGGSAAKQSRKRASAVELNGTCYLQIEASPSVVSPEPMPALEPREYRGGISSLPRHGLDVELELLEASLNSTTEDHQEEQRRAALDARKCATRASLFGSSRKKGKKRQSRGENGMRVRSSRDPEQKLTVDLFANKSKELFA